jgi:hypothetical protein
LRTAVHPGRCHVTVEQFLLIDKDKWKQGMAEVGWLPDCMKNICVLLCKLGPVRETKRGINHRPKRISSGFVAGETVPHCFACFENVD